MLLFFDTNVLTYAHDSVSKNYREALRLRNAALDGELEACVSYQNIIELYSILTNPVKLSKPYDSGAAAELCELYIKSKNIPKIMPTEQTYSEALRLADRVGASSTKIFDCLLAATARENGVETIYTENTGDFKPFKFITAVNPFLRKR
jgi:predicted nucleic acid-binding protein